MTKYRTSRWRRAGHNDHNELDIIGIKYLFFVFKIFQKKMYSDQDVKFMINQYDKENASFRIGSSSKKIM